MEIILEAGNILPGTIVTRVTGSKQYMLMDKPPLCPHCEEKQPYFFDKNMQIRFLMVHEELDGDEPRSNYVNVVACDTKLKVFLDEEEMSDDLRQRIFDEFGIFDIPQQ